MGAQPTLGVDPAVVHSTPEFALGTLATGLADPSKAYRYCKNGDGTAIAEGAGSDPASTVLTVTHVTAPWTVQDDAGVVAGVPANGESVPVGSYFWVQVDGVASITAAVATEADVGAEVVTDEYLVIPGSTRV